MTTATPADLNLPRTHAATTSRRRWLREPLLHFIAIGALIFAIDYALVSARGDGSEIVLGASADAELRETFFAARNREPTPEELQTLRRRWFDNELLYREGLALGLDRGDTGIRERVIFKALNVIQAGTRPPEATEDELRAWHEQRREVYDEPARVDFLEVAQVGATLAEAETFARMLNATRDQNAATAADLRIHRGRPAVSIAPTWGEAFATALATMPIGEWRALDSSAGPRVVRVDVYVERKPLPFEAVRGRVAQDWKDATAADARTAAVRALESKYRLVVAAEQDQ